MEENARYKRPESGINARFRNNDKQDIDNPAEFSHNVNGQKRGFRSFIKQNHGKNGQHKQGTDMIEHNVAINGIMVNAVYSEQSADGIFIPLLKQLTRLQRQKGRRILAMLAAPPGAGKTTLLTFLEKLSREREDIEAIQIIGMDGFHRRQEYLQSHYVLRDGKQVAMVDIKGAPVTFDLERLTSGVKKVAAGEACGWPVYDRLLHNPVEDAIHVDGNIILLEGNYLLLDEDGWRDLSASADYTIFIRAGEEFLRTRLIDRRMKTGVDEEKAIRFVDYSDMPNVRICLEKTKPADLQLAIDDSGNYHVTQWQLALPSN